MPRGGWQALTNFDKKRYVLEVVFAYRLTVSFQILARWREADHKHPPIDKRVKVEPECISSDISTNFEAL